MLFDTHCHLDLEPLSAGLPQLLQRAGAAGVERFLVPGIRPDGWERISALCAADSRLLAAFGIHPQLAALATAASLKLLADYAGRATAIGEIGLDYSYAVPPRDAQQTAFRQQLRIALDYGLPVIVHCRGAFADLLRIMKEEGIARTGGIMHAFSGSPEVALECIRLGFFISICGTVTYDNAVRPLKVARQIPLERLVLETDSPDMAPQLYRGQTNEPAYLVEIAGRLAAIKGLTLGEVAAATSGNAAQCLKLTH